MDTLRQDLKFALRMLARNPGFSIVAVLVLALGIGATTAMFTVVNSVLLHPLPYPEPDKLINVYATRIESPDFLTSLSVPNFLDWRDQSEAFESIASYIHTFFTLTGDLEPERLRGARVSTNVFELLGLRPAYGRSFAPEEDKPGQDKVILLSYGFWQSRFSGGNVTGKVVRIDEEPYTIIGAMPPLASPFDDENFFIPWRPRAEGFYALRNVGASSFLMRLKPGISLEEAQAEADTIAARLEEAYPGANKGKGIRLIPLHEMTVRWVRTNLLVLTGAVGFVLLIVCTNVASLLLARASTRQQEVAVRAAMGAGRGRLVRQLLTESVLLSSMGSVLGLLLAWMAVRVLVPFFPPTVPRVEEIGIDLTVALFAVAAALATGGLAGIAPALAASQPKLVEGLKQSRGYANATGMNWMRNILIVAEVSLALTLLAGAGLMVRSFLKLQGVNPGVNADNLLSFNVNFPQRRFPERAQRIDFIQRLHRRLGSLPGVTEAAVSGSVPVSGMYGWTSGAPGKEKPVDKEARRPVSPVLVGPSHFRLLKIPLLKGRYINNEDTEQSRPVAVVDEEMARQFWPDQDPIGQYMFISFDSEPREIVGVVGKVKYGRLQEEWRPITYLPYRQRSFINRMSFILRTAVEPMSLVPAVKSHVRALDPDLPVLSIRTTEGYYERWLREPRFYLSLFGIFAGLAVVIAAVGIYGVISYSVSQRTHEIGVRIALGAQRGNILAMVLRQGMTLVAVGVGIGLLASYWLTRYMESFLFEVEPTDPATFVVVSLVLSAVALLACYIPALRATRVDPMEALRYE